jgi:hypothetical protein
VVSRPPVPGCTSRKEGAPLSTSTAPAVPPAIRPMDTMSSGVGRSRPAAATMPSVTAGVKA